MTCPIRVAQIPYQVPYALGFRLQEHLVAKRIAARAVLRKYRGASPTEAAAAAPVIQDAQQVALTDFVLLLEHTPVYTQGRRHDEAAYQIATAPRREADFFQTTRGGLLTYHGPGQLVGYPIFDLGQMQLSLRCYVAKLQETLRAVLHTLDVPTVDAPSDDARHTGVWVGQNSKIGSLGVHVQHRVTSHGFALNVEEKALDGFRKIVACGLPDVHMTCVNEQLRNRGSDTRYDVAHVAHIASGHISKIFKRDCAPASSLLTWGPDSHSILSHVGGEYGFN